MNNQSVSLSSSMNWKGKRKWLKKWGRPQDAGDKENVALYKKFHATEKGHGSQHVDQ